MAELFQQAVMHAGLLALAPSFGVPATVCTNADRAAVWPTFASEER